MKKNLVWSKESLTNLQEIEDYIAKDNPKAAVEFINKLIARAESIISHPGKGRVVPEITVDSIRELLYKNYRIVYMVRQKSVVIVTVFEGHKLLDTEETIVKTQNCLPTDVG